MTYHSSPRAGSFGGCNTPSRCGLRTAFEHYLPLLYVLGAQDKADRVKFFADKVTLGSMSMRSVRLG
jgi:aromatic ring-opening dioxygenase catalytic subunit (LigB family)